MVGAILRLLRSARLYLAPVSRGLRPVRIEILDGTGRATGVLHTFFQLDDGSCLAFFEAPDMPFDFKQQHDFDLHIALEVEPDAIDKMMAKGKAEGREVRGVSDHHFIRSIYFRDPNGYVIELTAKVPGRESDLDPKKNRAREMLDKWQATKPAAVRAA